jgi:hypothetical protein
MRRFWSSSSVALTLVVSPTAMELEPSDTETEAMRLASAVRSSEEMLLASVMVPEHENIPIVARVMPAPLESLRFIMTLMNRATGFSRAARYSQRC